MWLLGTLQGHGRHKLSAADTSSPWEITSHTLWNSSVSCTPKPAHTRNADCDCGGAVHSNFRTSMHVEVGELEPKRSWQTLSNKQESALAKCGDGQPRESEKAKEHGQSSCKANLGTWCFPLLAKMLCGKFGRRLQKKLNLSFFSAALKEVNHCELYLPPKIGS